ncbi:hypothetical protein SPHINGOAX6_71147 [Sphingomonas sp. AX6]|nr:hypothetical protein SPHINGOAX6_71147 [Sphingomonas sp. AX6]
MTGLQVFGVKQKAAESECFRRLSSNLNE